MPTNHRRTKKLLRKPRKDTPYGIRLAIKLVLQLNAHILQHTSTINKGSTTTAIRKIVKNELDALHIAYDNAFLREITQEFKIILMGLKLAYGRKIPKPLVKTTGLRKHSGGGPYLAHLIDKGDAPITGNDFKKAVDDITQILGTVMFAPAITEDFGAFGASTVLDIFTGNDVEAAESYFKWHLSPKYVSYYPPELKTDKIWEVLKSAQNYLNVYFTHEKIKNQALLEEGKITADAAKPSALEALSQKVFNAEMELSLRINPALAIQSQDWSSMLSSESEA
jgi:hypothetical protein